MLKVLMPNRENSDFQGKRFQSMPHSYNVILNQLAIEDTNALAYLDKHYRVYFLHDRSMA